jgi:phospholipid/cholesterol/gamma-HCH transport system permease protein
MLEPKNDATIEMSAAGAGVRCAGTWTVAGIPALERRLAGFAWPGGAALEFDCSGIGALDTAGGWLLHRTVAELERAGREVTLAGLKPEHEALLGIIRANAVERAAPPAEPGWLESLGRRTRRAWQQALGMLAFAGECTVAALRSVLRPSRIRWRTILHNVQTAGFEALPITGLLSFLMGVVIAYQGAEQLRRYGANIFIADLVGLSMLRELGPLLTAIIVAGRSGSAYAAQIGTMKVTEEIDALRTIGVPPLELLVLPKLLALAIALPLLTVFADILGVLGGMVMAQTQLGVGFVEFLDRFDDAVKLSSYLVGLGKAPVFAAIIALVGCYQGFQVSGSADSVGRQTTVSVVQAIFLVIVTDALFSVVFSALKL